jgi:protein TonB
MKNLEFYFVVALILAPAITFAQGQVGGSAGDHPGGAPEMLRSTSGLARISPGVAQRLLVKKVEPQYPEDARRAHIEGQVVLRAVIDKNGNVESAALIQGHPLLAQAALEAVKKWKYKPYVLNGHATAVETQIAVIFVQLSGH